MFISRHGMFAALFAGAMACALPAAAASYTPVALPSLNVDLHTYTNGAD